MGDNPFDLSRRTPAVTFKKYDEQKVATAPQVTSKLEGYYEVPRSSWMDLPEGTHIRYVKVTGELRTGGFIKSKDIVANTITLETDKVNRSAANYKSFNVKLNDVAKVYSKTPSAPRRQPQQQPQPQYQQPRTSYYLPPQTQSYQEDDSSKITIAAFQSMFQTELSRINSRMSELEKKVENIIEIMRLKRTTN